MSGTPKNTQDFYQFAVHVLYGIVLATSFGLIGSIMIPIESLNPFYHFAKFVNFLGLMMIYVILLSGWIGYAKSIGLRPHRGGYGNARFVVDVMIIFVLAYMIYLVDPLPENFYFQSQFGKVFSAIIPILFALYVIWDAMKYQEYKDEDKRNRRQSTYRLWVTIMFFFISLIISGIYGLILTNNMMDASNKYHYYLLFICIIIGFTIGYRYMKWEGPLQNRVHERE